MPYVEGSGDPTETVYPYVPREVVEAIVAKHDGGVAVKEIN